MPKDYVWQRDATDVHFLLKRLCAFLTTSLLVFGMYVQFHGEETPGGGFQAGIILFCVLLILGASFASGSGGSGSGRGDEYIFLEEQALYRLQFVGMALYAGVGITLQLLGSGFLNYNISQIAYQKVYQKAFIIIVELGVMVSVFASFAIIFKEFTAKEPA